MLFVERHYLHAYGGGFTENFYGLKRERVLQVKGGIAPRTQIASPERLRETLQLGTGDVWRNLAVMVGLPYIKRKLDESYEIHAPQAMLLGPNYNRDRLPPDATLRQRLIYYYKWFLRNVYPSINAAYYFSILAFSLGYLFSNTAYSSPFLWLVQTRIRRLGAADQRAIALASQPLPQAQASTARPGQNNSVFNPRTFATAIIPRLLSSLRMLLPTSIFALKFLEWWHASDFGRQLSRKATEGVELPPPIISGLPPRPAPLKPRPTKSVSLASQPGTSKSPAVSPTITQPKRQPPVSATNHLPILTVPAPTPTTSSLCPICLNSITTPTAAQTGFVYCYTCIFKWVEGTHDRQIAWMEGGSGGEGWGDEGDDEEHEKEDGGRKPGEPEGEKKPTSRHGRWESGKGRCAVTGRRVLGGTEGLRRVIV